MIQCNTMPGCIKVTKCKVFYNEPSSPNLCILMGSQLISHSLAMLTTEFTMSNYSMKGRLADVENVQRVISKLAAKQFGGS